MKPTNVQPSLGCSMITLHEYAPTRRELLTDVDTDPSDLSLVSEYEDALRMLPSVWNEYPV